MRRTARKSTPQALILPNQSRRRFIQGLAAGGVMASLSPWLKPAWAEPAATTLTGAAPAMRGTQFDLTIAETPVNFTGTPRMATTLTVLFRRLRYTGARVTPSPSGSPIA